ncbi:PAS domain-containing hybrid sensor histidine kinase/response regulator [Desulfogranum mediterraneum]|uniref:PAS domain-containing hybrid sensor histidine kinase/response regulator n=1 Tax=Desulfogranum mediterraneum TaxID=160661 RepID=UPI0004122471|nr:PAS domain S-box protein [Desulfogranum mediterraneum]
MADKPSYEELAQRVQELELDQLRHRRTEQALKESEEEYRTLLEGIPDLIYSYSTTKGGTYYGPKVQAILGHSPSHLLQNPQLWRNSIHPEDSHRVATAIKDFQCGKPFEIEYRIKDAKGNWLWFRDRSIGRQKKSGEIVIEGIATDITKHKQAEQALRESEEKFRLLTEGSPVGIFLNDAQGNAVFINNKCAELIGIPAEEALNLDWVPAIHPQDREQVTREWAKSIKNRTEFHQEYRWVHPEGKVVWTMGDIVPVRGTGDEVLVYIGTLTDITARKLTEQALRQSENRFRELAENIQEVFWIFDWSEQRVVYVSPAYEKIWGRSVQSLLENYEQWTESIHPDDLQYALESFQNIVETGGGHSREYRIVRPDGEVRWLSDRGFVVSEPNEVVSRIVGIAEDITERKQAETLLQKSEEKYRFLADNVADALWILNTDTLTLEYVSPAIARIQGYSPEEFTAMPFEESFTPNSWRLVTHLISEEVKKEGSATGATFRPITLEPAVYCRDGTTKWVEITASVIRGGRNEVTGIIGVTRDISERMDAEKERKKLETQLQQAQKMEAIGTLAGGIAHDFNNILSAIFGYTELALEDAQKTGRPHNNLQEILKAGNRAKELVQQILTFSRQADQEQRPVCIKDVVKEALKLLRASLPSTIVIEQSIESNALVRGDAIQIHQIIMNLCTNAAHAMEESGGVLSVSLSDGGRDSEFSARHPNLQPGAYITLTVRDTGHGMPAAVLEKIFDPFFTTKEKWHGTGMGLSLVHGIVNSYKGIILAGSEPEKGSSFKVILPAIREASGLKVESEQPIPTGSERILFVDDEPAIVKLNRQLLEQLGYDVVVRTSSIEALELFKAQPDRFDLVITDMTMPQMTGEHLARELIRIRPDLPIILCTGFSANMDNDRALALGIRAYILKPILKRHIAETIRAVMDGR